MVPSLCHVGMIWQGSSLRMPQVFWSAWIAWAEFHGFWQPSFSWLTCPGEVLACTHPFHKVMPQKLLCSHSIMSDSLRPQGLQHTRLLCPPLSLRVCSNSCSSRPWCHPTISSSVVPFSYLQSFPTSGSFPMSWLLASGGRSIGQSILSLESPKY